MFPSRMSQKNSNRYSRQHIADLKSRVVCLEEDNKAMAVKMAELLMMEARKRQMIEHEDVRDLRSDEKSCVEKAT